jgi:8-oxo-dGTP diphosphatase
VHEFLGTLVYESGGRSKVVHYWRMETSGEQVQDLMDDVRAVDWLPLDAAVERLSRAYERVFLANVGPLALEAAALATHRPKARQPVLDNGRGQPVAATQPSLTIPVSAPPQPVASHVVEAEISMPPTQLGTGTQFLQADAAVTAMDPESDTDDAATTARSRRRNLVQKVRDWLRRAA